MTAVTEPDDWPEHLPPLVTTAPLAGGYICDTRRGRLADGRDVVLKRSPYPADAEVEGLAALAAAGVPVPPVLGWRGALLVLGHVAGVPDWPGLGRAVARMHRTTAGPDFGWHRDNRAGRFVQENGRLEHWGTFYAERRVRTHLGDPAVPADLAARLHRACDAALPALLPATPQPSLTHGDLSGGNVVDGCFLVDPEVSHADRELDVAFMHMSRGFPPEFWATYEQEWPFDPGYERRRPALQLHHRLLQVRHFGVERYRAHIEAVLDHYGW